MKADVFISHSSKDKHVADAICAVLERRGLRCWIAPRDVTPGASWGAAAQLTAEVAAPAPLRALWEARTQAERTPGRPRRDVALPPVEAERTAWGEARLTGAVLAWVDA